MVHFHFLSVNCPIEYFWHSFIRFEREIKRKREGRRERERLFVPASISRLSYVLLSL